MDERIKKTKDALDKFLSQAKDSVKILETFQKEAMTKAMGAIHLPDTGEAKRITNEKIVAGLKKMGLATQSEVRDLEKKVEALASELRGQISKMKKTSKKEADKEARN